MSLFYNVSNVFKKILAPSGIVFLCVIVYITINNDITNIVNNVKFSKLKNQFLLLSLAEIFGNFLWETLLKVLKTN